MSKRDQFKMLLNENADTGTNQKDRILSSHLLPLDIDEGESLPQQDGQPNIDVKLDADEKQDHQLFEGNNPTIPSENMIGVPSEYPTEMLNTNIQLSEGTHSTSVEKNDQPGITTMVSKLKNLAELNVEDTHTRKTYLIDNQLLAELDAVSAGKKKGYKTKIINTGLRIVLELMKEDTNFKL